VTRRRAPRPAAAAVRRAREAFAPQTPLARVQSVWAEAVGEQLARVAEPSAERRGAVVVRCEDAVWAQELDLMGPQILDRLRELIGDGAPAALRFEVGSAAGRAAKEAPGWPSS
jgi:predicted nucleic acid-binding Zn ribbon protein